MSHHGHGIKLNKLVHRLRKFLGLGSLKQETTTTANLVLVQCHTVKVGLVGLNVGVVLLNLVHVVDEEGNGA